MHDILLAGACTLALFSNSYSSSPPSSLAPNASACSTQCSAACSQKPDIEAVLAEARRRVAMIPVTHSQKIVSYTEHLRGPAGSYPRRNRDFEERSIPLELFNPTTGEQRSIIITRRIVNGTLPIALTSDDGEFIIVVEDRPSGRVWNWWNTALAVVAPEGWLVAANNWKRESTGESLVYTPFSVALATTYPELIDLGEQHVDRDVQVAFEHLRHVPSRVDSRMSVADMLTKHLPDLVHAIISVEHADPYDVSVFRQGKSSFDPLERPFVIFGSNGNAAFNATRSSAGAMGVMQVMPGTWSDMQGLYPSARLPSRSRLPAHSHPEEIVAGLLTADYHLSLLANYARRRNIALNALLARDDLQSLALASFNGGPGRVGVQLRNPSWRDKLHPETRSYLAKFDGWSR